MGISTNFEWVIFDNFNFKYKFRIKAPSIDDPIPPRIAKENLKDDKEFMDALMEVFLLHFVEAKSRIITEALPKLAKIADPYIAEYYQGKINDVLASTATPKESAEEAS